MGRGRCSGKRAFGADAHGEFLVVGAVGGAATIAAQFLAPIAGRPIPWDEYDGRPVDVVVIDGGLARAFTDFAAAQDQGAMTEPDAPLPKRWALMVASALESAKDPRTLSHWARIVGAAVPTLRVWCNRAGLSARTSLLLARVLRAAHLSATRNLPPAQTLEIIDPRTWQRVQTNAGAVEGQFPKDVFECLERQRYVDNARLLGELRGVLSDRLARREKQLIAPLGLQERSCLERSPSPS